MGIVTDVFLPLALAFIMFALGMGLTFDDFARVAKAPPGIDTIESYLRDRHLLLILDNCEHVLETAAAFIDRVLRGCPGIQLLATSRERLGIDGEVVFRVPPLDTLSLGDTPSLDDLERADVVTLFVDRARSSARSFAITPENAADVWRICRRLDGIPLAIELAFRVAGVLESAVIG